MRPPGGSPDPPAPRFMSRPVPHVPRRCHAPRRAAEPAGGIRRRRSVRRTPLTAGGPPPAACYTPYTPGAVRAAGSVLARRGHPDLGVIEIQVDGQELAHRPFGRHG